MRLENTGLWHRFFPYALLNLQKVPVGVVFTFAQTFIQTRYSMLYVVLHDEFRRGKMTYANCAHLPHPPSCRSLMTMPRQIQTHSLLQVPASRPAWSASLWCGRPIPGTYYTDPIFVETIHKDSVKCGSWTRDASRHIFFSCVKVLIFFHIFHVLIICEKLAEVEKRKPCASNGYQSI